MITINDYQEQYEYFLAEQELFKGLFKNSFDFINESISIVSLNEGFKETIINYISKITTALEKAWDKFKEIVTRGVDIAYLKAIKGKIDNTDPKFIIKNYVSYNTRPLNDIKIIPFNYEEMKESLNTKKDFLSKYYSNIYRDPEKSLNENIDSIVIKQVSDVQCTKEFLKDIYEITLSINEIIKNVEQDLKAVNVSNKNIERIVSTIPDSQIQSEAVAIYEQYITEEEKKSMEFVDTGDNSGNKGSLTKVVTNYLSASTDIISAEMRVYRNEYAQCMRILKHAIKPKETEEFEDQKVEQSTTRKTEINI